MPRANTRVPHMLDLTLHQAARREAVFSMGQTPTEEPMTVGAFLGMLGAGVILVVLLVVLAVQ
jgi:hypothetical protein